MKKLKPPAPSPFIIAPWEHVGAHFDPMPDATVRVAIGGTNRNLLLKMRDGRLFFKEPSRAQIYATLDRFDEDLIGDALVEKWEAAVESDNYGALVTKRDYFPRLPIRAQLIFLVKPDGSALVQEHFDGQTWFDLPQAAITPSLWNKGAASDVAGLLLSAAQNLVLGRVVTPQQRAAEPVHFVGGTPAEFAILVRGAVEAFVPATPQTFEFNLKSHSAFHAGENSSGYSFPGRHYADFGRVWELLEAHRPFVGLEWHEGEEQTEYPREKLQRMWKAGIEKWGENWRGNWAPQRGRYDLKVNPAPSAHERLESRLALRDFLNSLDSPEAAELLAKL